MLKLRRTGIIKAPLRVNPENHTEIVLAKPLENVQILSENSRCIPIENKYLDLNNEQIMNYITLMNYMPMMLWKNALDNMNLAGQLQMNTNF